MRTPSNPVESDIDLVGHVDHRRDSGANPVESDIWNYESRRIRYRELFTSKSEGKGLEKFFWQSYTHEDFSVARC